MQTLSPLAMDVTCSPVIFSLSPTQPVNTSFKGIASKASPGSPALARAMSEDALAGVPTPTSEMVHCWTPFCMSLGPQANTPSTMKTDASKACKGMTDGNCWNLVKDVAATYGLSSPHPNQPRATPLSYEASASMSPQLSWPGLQLSDTSPPGVKFGEALAWSPSMFLISSPTDVPPDASHCTTPPHTRSAISQQDGSAVPPFVLPSDSPHEHTVANEESPAAHAATTSSSDSAQTVDRGIEVMAAAMPVSSAEQSLSAVRESLPAPESAATATPEAAAVPKAAAAKRGRKASSRKENIIPLQVRTRRQTAAHEKHLQRMRRVGDTWHVALRCC